MGIGWLYCKQKDGGWLWDSNVKPTHTHTHTHFAFHEKYVMDDGRWWFALLHWPPSCKSTKLIWLYPDPDHTASEMGMRVSRVAHIQNVNFLQLTCKHAFSYKSFVSFFHQIEEHFKSKLVEHSTRRINCSKSSTKWLGFNLQEVGIGICALCQFPKTTTRRQLRFITEL